jgi:hypothetical protein
VGRPFAALPPLLLLIAGKLLAVYFIYNGTLVSFSIAIALGELISVPGYLYLNKKYLQVGMKAWLSSTFQTLAPVLAATIIGAGLVGYIKPVDTLVLRLFISLPIIIGLCFAAYFVTKPPIIEEVRNAFAAIKSRRGP